MCIRDRRRGARSWDGSNWTHHPTVAVTSIDPTGAGDAFIGGYLGTMLGGKSDPVATALDMAGHIVVGPGAAPLIDLLKHDTTCLLYTSDAADDLTRVDLGGRRIIQKK